ncbi:hypothetical protein QUF54_02115 [Candidatus Marithioploca araucensis]|uniref:Uncharacterized protein n=1 Tax=Candidatus Marithioploca araucensis TaxID=70273 RepID=A0ABT7VR41_9GAMM|nr:hypothetical protein [Candidatus Marithioploca araucensis]
MLSLKILRTQGSYVELLGKAGCDDALVGIGQEGRIAFIQSGNTIT